MGVRNTIEKHLYVLNTKPNKELTDKPLSDNSIVFLALEDESKGQYRRDHHGARAESGICVVALRTGFSINDIEHLCADVRRSPSRALSSYLVKKTNTLRWAILIHTLSGIVMRAQRC